ncbi:MAG: hypothetical protein CEN88_330 [Candidatus Berkelbacteria bacterium Licking1014_2]|uniref:DZANK-type domain-containing protein n=1 Tax=Candidatus Berkelbacteria bacterium Licking1014_2 TaxID=2017146 RepID=A0A554LUH0_9BACT|nr:MAG: hypothetical protein CEN88_330 [Candidatus Berkelbacteria bacterium Licking1014_2]
MKCPKCDCEIREEEKFCRGCGQSLLTKCEICEKEHHLTVVCCHACGDFHPTGTICCPATGTNIMEVDVENKREAEEKALFVHLYGKYGQRLDEAAERIGSLKGVLMAVVALVGIILVGLACFYLWQITPKREDQIGSASLVGFIGGGIILSVLGSIATSTNFTVFRVSYLRSLTKKQ